jgi:hypothetical protein
VAKVRINGEFFEFDSSHKPMAEALELEKALKVTYGQWESDLAAGSARAVAGLIWLVWRRNGREVPFEDIVSGAVEVNLADFGTEEEVPDPTTAPADRGASPTTGAGTSRRSAK